jgi:hypothetical protein
MLQAVKKSFQISGTQGHFEPLVLNLAQKFSMKKLENEKGLQMTREL